MLFGAILCDADKTTAIGRRFVLGTPFTHLRSGMSRHRRLVELSVLTWPDASRSCVNRAGWENTSGASTQEKCAVPAPTPGARFPPTPSDVRRSLLQDPPRPIHQELHRRGPLLGSSNLAHPHKHITVTQYVELCQGREFKPPTDHSIFCRFHRAAVGCGEEITLFFCTRRVSLGNLQ
ncbi:hypothetical protein LX32DRAFT_255884 [Colletotrichum zoysiae]|uniref:Uncharacterized protein n=1 Tax=Colletotrichum zoysiae TaxID=1216348 RepID=A0AAD9HTX8_9PEZI|nr:hypothetical protein LX32DRAFT_255884 [Colletotrichum zoysiae]